VDVILENNTFAYNFAGNIGAVLGHDKDCSFTVKNNIFANNQANSGAAIYYYFNGKGLYLINNLFVKNYSKDDYASVTGFGGGAVNIKNVDYPVVLMNNTFANNRHDYMGGAPYLSSTTTKLINNVFYNNSAPNAPEIIIIATSNPADSTRFPEMNYNCIQGGLDSIGVYVGTGKIQYDSTYLGIATNNISADPRFVNPSLGYGYQFDGLSANWALEAGSPCINAANPYFTVDSIGTEFDLAGNPRIYMFDDIKIADMGAYEFQEIPTAMDKVEILPQSTALYQNYPNPFNPTTTIRYNLNKVSTVNISVYDILGKRIKELVNAVQNAGEYKISWDGKNNIGNSVSTGVYYYKLQTVGFSAMKKMIYIR
ncbi:MAG: T9SS type A sorting domain-containing protein, partial [Calditrichaeota bacterium]|nr:T9SS type A sorting domain-containing protein [Calditrichota bacterium]